MEEHENLYEKIKEILGGGTANMKILEQQVDMDLLMEYYDCSMRVKEEKDEQWAMDHIQYLGETGYSEDVKKEILARLAGIEKVECYRAIEATLEAVGDTPLGPWAILALNESRMLLESKIMDENQVFISTGLGGRDEKLRYFVVLISKTKVLLTPSQQMVIKNEFDDILNKFDAEVEEMHFNSYLATLTLLLPMQYSLKSVFREAIDECNRYGNFLNDDFIVTNVRKLSFGEIEEFLESREREVD
jgi:hypothetical protein